jgi:hypothetical protein
MVAALARQVRLLDAYIEKALTDADYLSEIAGKLRLLIIDIPGNRRHKPLLLEVAQVYQVTQRLTPEEGADREPFTWPQFLDRAAATLTDGSGEPRNITFREFIRAWAEQAGGTHEDWEIDQSLIDMINLPGVYINSGLRVSHHNLIAIARNVSRSATTLLGLAEGLQRIKSMT